jgi:predicted transglutaminase-like cysteine proteinase
MSGLRVRRAAAYAFSFAISLTFATVTAVQAGVRDKSVPLQETAALGFSTETHISAPAQARWFTINQVLAERSSAPGSDQVRLAALHPNESAAEAANASLSGRPSPNKEPFGLFAFRAPDGPIWDNWRNLSSALADEAEVVAKCQNERSDCASPAARKFLAIIEAARAKDGRARIELVNDTINDAIQYETDQAQYGVPDLWSAPLASLTTGHGDCEDYAIAKYEILQRAGVATEDLRLLVGRDRAIRQDHAVLAVRDSGHWFILDNRTPMLFDSSEFPNFIALFSIDHEGVKLLAAPYAKIGLDKSKLKIVNSPGAVKPRELAAASHSSYLPSLPSPNPSAGHSSSN